MILNKYYQELLEKSVYEPNDEKAVNLYNKEELHNNPYFNLQKISESMERKKRKIDQIESKSLETRSKRKTLIKDESDEEEYIQGETSSDDEYTLQHVEKPKIVDKKKPNHEQKSCCLKDCHNSVTNRLRFSLRTHKPEDFREEFIQNGWNKVCHYHYFSDLYKFKKANHGNIPKPLSKGKKKVKKEEFEEFSTL